MTSANAPRIAVIGAGFAGLGMAYYLKRAGFDDFVVLEKAAGLGGVWRENTYPGAACDVPSHLYSFSFDPHYPWSSAFAPQREILAYLEHVARRHDLVRHIRFGREVTAATYDERRAVWSLTLACGAVEEYDVLIAGVGQLHRPALPAIPGRERFGGRAFHSACWDHGYDFAGTTVAAIGTGPSAIQYVPELAKKVARLHVFQRSPAWLVHKHDRAYTRLERWLLANWPWTHSLDRIRIYWYVEFVASVIQRRSAFHWLSKGMVRAIHEILLRRAVRDPALRAKLTPDFPIGCKRLQFSNDWFRTLAQPHVELVTTPIAAIDERGILGDDGVHRAVDAIVYGTGFAATELLAPLEVTGRAGVTLRERWRKGAEAYLGVAVDGFPNFFLLYGPNTNLGVGTIVYMLERQQRYVVKCLAWLRGQRLRSLEVRADAQRAFNDELVRRSARLVYLGGCNSWYLTGGRNTQNWVGYMTEYGWRMRTPRREHFVAVPA